MQMFLEPGGTILYWILQMTRFFPNSLNNLARNLKSRSHYQLHGTLLDGIFLARSFKCILEIFHSFFKFFYGFEGCNISLCISFPFQHYLGEVEQFLENKAVNNYGLSLSLGHENLQLEPNLWVQRVQHCSTAFYHRDFYSIYFQNADCISVFHLTIEIHCSFIVCRIIFSQDEVQLQSLTKQYFMVSIRF